MDAKIPRNESKLRLSSVQFSDTGVADELRVLYTHPVFAVFICRLTGDVFNARRTRHSVDVYDAGADVKYCGGFPFVRRGLIGRPGGEPHFLDRLRQYFRRSLVHPVLDVAGFLLQYHPEADDVGPFTDYPLDVRHAALAGHALDVDFNRAGLRDLPRFRRARYLHQMRGTLIIGVVGAIPANFHSEFRIV